MIKNMNKPTTTIAIIRNDQGELLLIKRGREPYKNHWSLVSGIGESRKGLDPKDAVLGEVLWDVGTPLLNHEELFSIGIGGDQFTDNITVFVGSVNESGIKLRPGYSVAFQWLSLEEALGYELAFEHAEILLEYGRWLRIGFGKSSL